MKLREVMKQSLRKRIKQLKKGKSATNQREILLLKMKLHVLEHGDHHEVLEESREAAS
jgi:hypothetical protein